MDARDGKNHSIFGRGETNNDVSGKKPRRVWKLDEDKGTVTYDDVDGDDLGHGAAGACDWTRATSDEGTSGEEVGEELTRKDRGEGALLLVYRGSIGV